MPGKEVKNWPQYEKLREKGMPKGQAARITNASAKKKKAKKKGAKMDGAAKIPPRELPARKGKKAARKAAISDLALASSPAGSKYQGSGGVGRVGRIGRGVKEALPGAVVPPGLAPKGRPRIPVPKRSTPWEKSTAQARKRKYA